MRPDSCPEWCLLDPVPLQLILKQLICFKTWCTGGGYAYYFIQCYSTSALLSFPSPSFARGLAFFSNELTLTKTLVSLPALKCYNSLWKRSRQATTSVVHITVLAECPRQCPRETWSLAESLISNLSFHSRTLSKKSRCGGGSFCDMM